MQRFIYAIQQSIRDKNWYSALFLSLTLPDICASLEKPDERSKARYLEWWERYMLHKYTSYIGPNRDKHIFLTPMDAYLLRCSCLHEGSSEISTQRIKSALESFHFIQPPSFGSIHCNQSNSTLQLQIDVFCQDICDAAKQWMTDNKGNPTVSANMSRMLCIHSTENGVRF